MKHCIAIGLLVLSYMAFSQTIDVPHKVKVQFNDGFISATEMAWKNEQNDRYTCIFFHQSHYKKATFSNDGVLLVLETRLTSLAQMPQEVAGAMIKKFKLHIVDRMWKSETAGETVFNFVTRRNQKNIALSFFSSGRLKKKTKRIIQPAPFD